ncbi:MAG: glutamate 5-kinase [Cyclobacteriaceae bacterium]
MSKKHEKILIKIGSNVLTLESGLPDVARIAHIVEQVAELRSQGTEVILVSSGAVAAGRSKINSTNSLDTISRRQVLASIGQVELMKIYNENFSSKNLLCSQVLVTKEDFRTRAHYLNMKNCLEALLNSGITPIINENDVISITELMFTDNDELSGLVAAMMDVDALVILTNVDGIYTGNPSDSDSQLISEYNENEVDLEEFVVTTKSNFGRGGMVAKANTATKLSKLGVEVYIGNGLKEGIVKDLLGKKSGTSFAPVKNGTSNVKKWVAQSGSFAKGHITVNAGAKDALTSKQATSLLPIGVVEILGEFKKGDVINIIDEKGKSIGLGQVKYDSDKAREYMGVKGSPVLVHYNYLVLS